MAIRINDKKRIGRVLFLVEGDVDEINIVKHIFYDVFNYTVIKLNRDNHEQECFQSNKDKYSFVCVAPMEFTAIKKIDTSEEYIDSIFYKLKEYGLKTDNIFTYFLFDRDRQSNKSKDVKKALLKLRNSQENDCEMNGMLLISYPCCEAFLCNCNNDFGMIDCSKSLKNYSKKYKLNSVQKKHIKDGCEFLLRHIKDLTGLSLTEVDLQDMSLINTKVFDNENFYFKQHHVFKILSMIFVCLLDLGILEIK